MFLTINGTTFELTLEYTRRGNEQINAFHNGRFIACSPSMGSVLHFLHRYHPAPAVAS
jgi:hypothetical protein